MAMTLKENKTYTDEMGIDHTNPYLVIDVSNGNKRDLIQTIIVDIYANQSMRNADYLPVETRMYEVRGDHFSEYFSPAAIAADSDQYAQSYVWIKQLKNNDDEFIYSDWQDA